MGWMLNDGQVRVSSNVTDQVIQLTKEKGLETGPTYNGWATPGVSQQGASQPGTSQPGTPQGGNSK
jgi:hypothetical protein